jgi:integrase/recombinase XerD
MAEKSIKLNLNKRSSLVVQKNNEFTFRDFFEIFKEFHKMKRLEGLAESSLENYNLHIVKNLGEFLKGHKIQESSEVSVEIIRDYIGWMMTVKKLKNSTINIRLRTLRAYLKWLYTEEKIEIDIPSKVKLVKQEKKKIEVLSTYEIKLFIAQIDRTIYSGYRDYTIALLMLETGVRANECVHIEEDDIELKNRTVRIKANHAKTRRERTVIITKKLSKLLKVLIDICKETNCTYVFQQRCGGKLAKRQLQNLFARYSDRAGFKRRATPHIFRHTFASNFIRMGGNAFVLRELMGHTTMEMSLHYVHQSTEGIKKAFDKLELTESYFD